jgi:competence protein ComEC
LCCLPLFVPSASGVARAQLRVTAFDVGQGSAILLETQHHRYLYDTGPTFSIESNAATRVILPYFYGQGISQLDGLMLSHGDSDHIGGAASVLNEISVKQMHSSLPSIHELMRIAQKKAIPHTRCSQGLSWEWDGVRFEVLHPHFNDYLDQTPDQIQDQVSKDVEQKKALKNSKPKTNPMSCVLKVSTPQYSILLLGDIEKAQEKRLVETQPEQLKTSILMAPHHGSGTSSSLAFLQATQAQYGLFQVGYRNSYRHPKAEVWQRYLDIGIHPLRTDQEGAIQIQLGATLNLQSYRSTYVRYWHEKGRGTMP